RQTKTTSMERDRNGKQCKIKCGVTEGTGTRSPHLKQTKKEAYNRINNKNPNLPKINVRLQNARIGSACNTASFCPIREECVSKFISNCLWFIRPNKTRNRFCESNQICFTPS